MKVNWSIAGPDYSRGPEHTVCHGRRLRAAKERRDGQPIENFFKSAHTEPYEGIQDGPPVELPYPETYERPGDDSITQEDEDPDTQYDFLAAAIDLAEHTRRNERTMKRDLRQKFGAVMSCYLIRNATTDSTKSSTVAESMSP